ncbi:hypothetical protein JHN55_26310 [Streptomyces sp. MBT56]|uniref:hypothetical protein n=1 Tax=unclassified Streptomyces TaxID=2593676 RepID=UPI00190BFC29|nr:MULTISPECIES: hypothetical protein [unclassified Streptomyces]MBK3559976.1 hypothetical protein [Streptomyces sp. MBT56]MBK3600468.1 hypothetical protein [Streptomyces sp. MBT54]MBK3613986.1 hypothetical protein [Streptomyces sp. MBT98]MBK6041960.1 hypothetical protein [Streptomyces sp. MBT55]
MSGKPQLLAEHVVAEQADVLSGDGGRTTSYPGGPRGNGSFTGQVPYVGATLDDAVTYVSGAADAATANH